MNAAVNNGTQVRYPLVLVPRRRLAVDAFARRADVHPELVRRLVALGLLEGDSDASGRLTLAPDQLAALARIRRLRSGLQLNYAGLGVVIDLLDRIQLLEQALRTHRAWRSHQPWT